MSEDMRVWLTALSVVMYVAFTILAIRSAIHARRLARQWENTAGDNWQWGKAGIVIAVVGLFLMTQRVEPVLFPWIAVGFFLSLGLLLYGEWRMGNGFRDVADAQEKWHRRNFGEE